MTATHTGKHPFRDRQPHMALLLILLNLLDVASTYIGLSTGLVVETNTLVAPLTDQGRWLELTLVKASLPAIAFLITLCERCRAATLGMALVAANLFYGLVLVNNVWVTLSSTLESGWEIALWNVG